MPSAPSYMAPACLPRAPSLVRTTMARGPTWGRTPSNFALKSRQGCSASRSIRRSQVPRKRRCCRRAEPTSTSSPAADASGWICAPKPTKPWPPCVQGCWRWAARWPRPPGRTYLRPRIVTSGSDDFHFYTRRNLALQAAMLAVGANVQPGLHHPAMTFDGGAMERAVDVLVASCRRLVSQSGWAAEPQLRRRVG